MKGTATDFSGSKNEILQKIDALARDLSVLKAVADSLDKAMSELVSESTQQSKDLQTANEKINQVLTNLKSHEASLQSAVKAIEEKNDKVKDELKGAIDTNKKILFGVVALVIIDIILRFI